MANMDATSDAPTHFEFRIDAQMRADSATLDITNAFRLASFGKDRALTLFDDHMRRSNPLPPWAMVLERSLELALIDTPLVAEPNILAHEIFGHGARLREFGGAATYTFRPPPPFGFAPGVTNFTSLPHPFTLDEQIVVYQARIATGDFERELVVHSGFESDHLNTTDAFTLLARRMDGTAARCGEQRSFLGETFAARIRARYTVAASFSRRCKRARRGAVRRGRVVRRCANGLEDRGLERTRTDRTHVDDVSRLRSTFRGSLTARSTCACRAFSC
jgi:hypothetical protein